MKRRNLRVVCSSDEEDDDDLLETLPPPIHNPIPNPNPVPPPPPLEISDDEDEFVDVPDDLSPPSSSPPISEAPPAAAVAVNGGTGSVCPIDEFLRNLGLRLRPDWLESCVAGLASGGSGFEGLDVAGMAKKCFEQFLLADMNICGAGVLPENVGGMHKAELEGPFVLQVDEIVNISAPIRERYHDIPTGTKRCLKLSMTDGVQHVFGMEYRPIKELEVLAPAGLKIVIRNVHVRRGLLMLVPEVLHVLGGLVDALDAARQRLVNEVNKPPRGKRKQVILPLPKRASLAAWSSDTTNNGASGNVSMPGDVGDRRSVMHSATLPTTSIMAEGIVVEESNYPPAGENNLEEHGPLHVEEITMEELAAPFVGENNVGKPHSVNNIPDIDPEFAGPATSGVEVTHASEVEDAVDVVEHPLNLSAGKEMPFTYLACLLAKWATQKDCKPYIHGKIKCFLTGVKGFQFKERHKFELDVYVDDGSLISEVRIDHNVVQNGIGHSPEEVTAALLSSDKKIVADMRETMRRFQLFLAKFEGTMLVEINERSTLPIVLEMNQGCSTSDPLLLLRRLKKFTPQNLWHRDLECIDVSP
ncbi:recQ-mediated genome instability protein 1 isoform X2 [Typha angustifolia]|uniref:recQ-mediated genome instability protein 1 isoform X2 n=1 Tax=Typha angustifolia TaxID=59011 RepID=UPI003C2E5627